MGCCNEKAHKKEFSSIVLCEEEEMIKNFEKELPFTRVWVDEVAGLYLQYKSKIMMNGQEAHHVLTSMGFNEEGLSDPDSLVYFFMKSLRNERGLYSIQKVFVTALLLSSGKSEEKAMMLFDMFDCSGIQALTRNELTSLIIAVFDVAVMSVPEVVVNQLLQCDDNGRMNKERFLIHWKRMEVRKTYFLNKILEKVLGEEKSVTRKKFVTKVVEDPVVGSLIWSYLIRLILLE